MKLSPAQQKVLDAMRAGAEMVIFSGGRFSGATVGGYIVNRRTASAVCGHPEIKFVRREWPHTIYRHAHHTQERPTA